MQTKNTERSGITFETKEPVNLTPSQKKQVKRMVYLLVRSIINDIDHKKKTKKITKQPRTYIQHRVSTPYYTRRGLTAGSSTQIITKKDWVHAIVKCRQEVRVLSEYVCLDTFLQKYIDNCPNYFIARLSEYVVKKYFEQDLSPKSIAKIQNTFIKDLEMKPSTSYVVAEVYGLQLRRPRIILTKKLQIDRTTKRDLEFESSELLENVDYGWYPDAMYRFKSDANTSVKHMTKLVTAALCLYRVGAIRIGKLISHSDSIVNNGKSKEFPGSRERRGQPIIFTKTDCQKFPEFWKKFHGFLSHNQNEIFKKFSYLNIAYDRYYDSLLVRVHVV